MDPDNQIVNGEREDPRTPEEKAQDFPQQDFLGEAIPEIVWREKPEQEWTVLPRRYQYTSSSCGGQAGAFAASYFFGRTESATPIYRARTNYPNQGMYMQEIGNILKKYGTTTDQAVPSQNMTEEQMNAYTLTGDLPDKIAGYYVITTDMDTIAAALEKGHAVVFLIRANHQEYTDVPWTNNQPATFGHFVSVIGKNYMLWNGQKAFVIGDSAAPGSTIRGTGMRIFTEEFIRNHCWGTLALIPTVEKPVEKYKFPDGLVLKRGSSGDAVKALQSILVKEGFLKPVSVTGYFGPITEGAVRKFQEKYRNDILVPAGVKKSTGVVAKFTRMKLNSLV